MDAIVIGAGLSGLAAAKRLVHGGHTVMLIEARNRVGGRVFPLLFDGSAIELGAEWVGNRGVVHKLLDDAGATVKDASGKYLRTASDGYKNAWDPEERSHPVLKDIANLEGPDRSLRDALAELRVSASDAATTLTYVEGFHAADPAEVGIRWLEEVEDNQSAAESTYRCEDGLGRLISTFGDSLGSACDIHLETVARAIRWGPYGVEVDVESPTGQATMRARAVIVTVPLPLLADLHIDPPVPGRAEAVSRIRMGAVAKIVLQFQTKFWEKKSALENLMFLFMPEQEIPTVWSGTGGNPVLNAWVGGPRARTLCALTDAEIIDRSLHSIANGFRMPRADVDAHLVKAHFHNWVADSFSRGAYTYGGVGGIDAYIELARPIGDAVYFAGEATIGHGYNATMEGAVLSGVRAAEELLGLHGSDD